MKNITYIFHILYQQKTKIKISKYIFNLINNYINTIFYKIYQPNHNSIFNLFINNPKNTYISQNIYL